MSVIYFFSVLFALLYVILILVYTLGWIRTKDYVVTPKKPQTSVSIIIPVRNEVKNIANCLTCVLNQSFPTEQYEVIVVDDDSVDYTASIVEQIATNSQNISLIKLKDEPSIFAHKKRAISTAIEKAQGDLIVTLDADCVVGKNWLMTIVNFYEEKKPRMIVSPVAFYEENGFFKKIQSLEFVGLSAVTGAAIRLKYPMMCNGANLAYEKRAFYEVGGFEGIDKIASGDDIMLMNKMNKKFTNEILFLKCTDAVVYTKACDTVSDFFQQRLRWASKAFKVKSLHTLFSAIIVGGFNILLFAAIVCGFYDIIFFKLFCFMFLLKLTVDFLLLFSSVGFFEKKKLLLYILPTQIFLLFVCYRYCFFFYLR